MSWGRHVAASALAALAACASEGTGPSGTPRAGLLALARTEAVNAAVFTVRNDQLHVDTVTFADSGTTVFAVFRFTPGSFATRPDGTVVCDTCTVQVSVTPLPDVFGFTVGPPGLVFRASSTPTVTVFFGTHADFSVHDSAAAYPDSAAFRAALDAWYERRSDEWRLARASGSAGAAAIAAAVDATVAHLIAAPK